MSLSTAQLQTLKTNLAANTAAVVCSDGQSRAINALIGALRTLDNAYAVAAWYNQTASPNFWVWESNSSLITTGMAIKMSDVGNLTTANTTRLQTSFQIRPGGFTPSNQDDRALFGGLFSVSGATGTRANLLAAWQRTASNIEKLLATGTGTQATGDINSDGSVTGGSPATLTFEGSVAPTDIQAAWAA